MRRSLTIAGYDNYKRMFEIFVMPSIHMKLGKRIVKTFKSYNTSLYFYKDDIESSIIFEYTFSPDTRLSMKTFIGLYKKLKLLGYELTEEENYNSSYPCYMYVITGELV